MISPHDMSKIHTSLSKTRQIIASGFTLIELIVAISIIAILSATALDKLFWYQGQAEKAAMEYTATMIKSSLWMSTASLMMANRSTEIPDLEKQNPINLLAQKPENYLGEINNANIASLASGNWFYDIANRQIVYVVRHRRDFKPEAAGDFTVRYGIRVIYGEIESTPGYIVPYVTGIAFIPLTKYSWH